MGQDTCFTIDVTQSSVISVLSSVIDVSLIFLALDHAIKLISQILASLSGQASVALAL